MFEHLPINLQELNFVTILFRMSLAIIIGGIIGTERDIKQRAAGLRTHILVCFGAAVVMMTNEFVFETYPNADIDITRMGAQVVSGIGFLGAGTILVTNKNRVEGLTTAAGLWAAASVGLAIGIGFYEIAFAGGLAIIAIVTLLRPLKRYIQSRTERNDVTLIVHSKDSFNNFLKYTSSVDVKISDLEIQKEAPPAPGKSDGMIFVVTISLGVDVAKNDLLNKLRAIEGIDDVVEISK